MTDDSMVPLPESLRSCGCPHAPKLHLMKCAPAIAYDETPLDQREGYVWDDEAKRSNSFEGFSWEWPLRITGSVSINVSLDPEAIILAHADEYRDFEMDGGYEYWEKPVQFLCHLIEEQLEHGGVFFGGRRMSADWSSLDELREYPHWTPEDTERVDALLGPRVDPNQGTLDV